MPAEQETDDRYTCALSGRVATVADLALDADPDDPLGDMPAGWLKITIVRRMPNPDWLRYSSAMQDSIAGQLAQIKGDITDEQRASAEGFMRTLAEANFHAVLRDTPRYIEVVGEAYISDPGRDPAIEEAWKEIGEALGIGLTA